jgi:carbonic anhydrase/SulP family sulfate permease
MTTADSFRPSQTLPRDLTSGLVVFLVALPLCLGVALASGAPLFSGLVAGIVGGLVVGPLSGSHTSVSGPAAGLTAVVAAQIAALGTFEAFLGAVVLAGALQLAAGIARGGSIANYFPSSVIRGLLAAIGVILILKQIPHLVGHDTDPVGEMAFAQPDQQTTFSELWQTLFDIHPGAALVGLGAIALHLLWDRIPALKKTMIPAPLVVVLGGVAAAELLAPLGDLWLIGETHRVQVPVAESATDFASFVQLPDMSAFARSELYVAALTIAIVASLETLLNLEAVDSLDPYQRRSDPNRELVAQGVGNMTAGLLGGLPVTSVIIRSSVNIQTGGRTRLATIFHGALLLICVATIPALLNRIPLSALAAILLITGFKLASPALFREMWSQGRAQFLPFAATLAAIVLTDLLVGILIGLAVAAAFILRSNMQRPIRRIQERHLGGDVLRIELANQVSFLNRAALLQALDEVPEGGHVMIDATDTDYIDPDVLALIHDFERQTAPARGVKVSLDGFRDRYGKLENRVEYVDYSTREVQSKLTPQQVVEILREGNERFREGRSLSRDAKRQQRQTASAQYPMAAVLGCIDSRAPVETLFDVGLGDVFVARIAGNVARSKVLGSLEYACVVAGAKLVVVLGHTSCGAVGASVDLYGIEGSIREATGCHHLDLIVSSIQESIVESELVDRAEWSAERRMAYANEISRRNVFRTVGLILQESPALAQRVESGEIGIVGALYDVTTGEVEFMTGCDGRVPGHS